MIVVTGGAGFIGSCIVARLNELGRENLWVVDHLEPGSVKARNLQGKRYARFFDKQEFLQLVLDDGLPDPVEQVIHMGACSSTTLDDEAYYQRNNFEYSCHVVRWALQKQARVVYASSAATYGDGRQGYRDDLETMRKLRPLNYYGQSKQDFDIWVLDHGLQDQVVGLKFFNVYGPNEYHKGDMRSVVAKAYQRVRDEGRIDLFKSYRDDYADGEQRRDFIYVKDVVEVVMYFLDHPDINGIYNLGTGAARSWNDLARALFAAVGQEPHITYTEMPESLRPRYQYFTQAEMSHLRQAGYSRPFTSLEDGVRDYAAYLKEGRCL